MPLRLTLRFFSITVSLLFYRFWAKADFPQPCRAKTKAPSARPDGRGKEQGLFFKAFANTAYYIKKSPRAQGAQRGFCKKYIDTEAAF